MSNTLYKQFKNDLLNGLIDVNSTQFKPFLLSSSYTYDPDHTSKSDVNSAIVAEGSVLSAVSADGDLFFADPASFVGLESTTEVTQLVIIVGGTNKLAAFIDSVDGFPFTASGGDYKINWGGPDGAVFRL